jgi:hypothetical protein
MKRAAMLLAFALAGCEMHIQVGGMRVCPPGTLDFGDYCVDAAALSGCGGIASLFFCIWIVTTIAGTAAAVRRIEARLNEKPPAPPGGDARS